MSINTSVTRSSDGNLISLDLSLSKDSILHFRTLLNRALNCYPQAPAEWKELSDMLEHGRILQNYSDHKDSVDISNKEYYLGSQYARVQSLIQKYGTSEWRLYTLISHELSLEEWEKKMKIKYPEKE